MSKRHSMPFVVLAMVLATVPAFAANPILGEVEIEAAGKAERDAGVWLDGQYVGNVKDLTGKGKLVVVPGEHELSFRLVGYEAVERTVVVEPGQAKRYRLAMRESPDVTYPDKDGTARLIISVAPKNAAVFVNDRYVGHVDRFDGRKGMRLAPGTYRFTIALPGYQAFETELALRAAQTYEIKTELSEGGYVDQAVELTAHALAD